MVIVNYLPPAVDSNVAVTSPLVVGVPVPAVSVELRASVGPLVSPAVVEDAAKRTIYNKSLYIYIYVDNQLGFPSKLALLIAKIYTFPCVIIQYRTIHVTILRIQIIVNSKLLTSGS